MTTLYEVEVRQQGTNELATREETTAFSRVVQIVLDYNHVLPNCDLIAQGLILSLTQDHTTVKITLQNGYNIIIYNRGAYNG